MDTLCDMTAVELGAELRKGSLGAEELTRFYLERIERCDPALNTVAEINGSAVEQARALDARRSGRDGILFGLPILVKDNIDVAGLHTTAGSLALSDNLARRSAAVIRNIVRNGGVILGKTNMTEFANFTAQGMPNGYSSRGGSVVSAYGARKDPGGSSTGSAVAVAAGLCAAAVGTDTSFSVVACAVDNGIAGLKPRSAALPSDGIVPIARTLDSAGALGRSLRDAILMYHGMTDGPQAPVRPIAARKLRIGVNLANRELVSDGQNRRYESLYDALRREGARLVEITQPYSPCQRTIMLCEFRRDLEDYLSRSSAQSRTLREIIAFYEAHPQTMMRYGIATLREAAGRSADEPAYREAMAERARLRGLILRELEGFDACVMTGPTNIMHLTGLPSLAVRMGMGEDGAPAGVILYGADERRLLAAALTIEAYGTAI